MDILKRIYNNTSICKLEGNMLHVATKTYPSAMPVEFPTEKSKKYTLGEVAFCLLNSNLSFTEYVARCQSAGVSPVNYLDQLAIKEDIAAFQTVAVPGTFLKPCYTHNLQYDIPKLDPTTTILLVNDITSRVTINNITTLLCENRLEPDIAYGTRSGAAIQFEKFGKKYVIYENMPKDAWEPITLVFIDLGITQANDWMSSHEKISRDAKLFCFQGGSKELVHAVLSGRKLQNYDEIWDRMKE